MLREAIQCGLEKYRKLKGLAPPARVRTSKAGGDTRSIPAAVRRAVWKRDGGRCTFVGADGRRCESRWQLELDHIHPAALGGRPTVDNIRVRCRSHNLFHAEQVFGREHMARFRRSGLTIAGDGSSRGEVR